MTFLHQVEPYITEDEVKAVSDYLRSGGWLTEFKKTEEFERMIADFLGVSYSVALTSGTVALYLSLLALGIGPGDSVVVPDFTMIATPNAVRWTGAEIVLCDVETSTFCLDLKKIRLQKNTKALIYVPINGRSGDMDSVVDYCKENQLYLLEDACQAFGSKRNGKYLGTFGDAGCFSFTPHKIVTTGQGGAIVTNREDIRDKVKKLKDFYRSEPGVDIHEDIGYNFKFTDLQAVVGIEQLKRIDWRMERKKAIFDAYRNRLEQIADIQIAGTDMDETVPWFIDILVHKDKKQGLIAYLKNENVGSRPFYPPVHLQPPYSSLKGDFITSQQISEKGLWLPSSIGLNEEEINAVCDKIYHYFEE